MNVPAFLDQLKTWAAAQPGVVGLALVGSHARGTERLDSDVDLVLLCADPQLMLKSDWYSRFGKVRSVALEEYGAMRSLRVAYENGPEVEFGITGVNWARIPLDPGTRNVLAHGARILVDPEGLFGAAMASLRPPDPADAA